ncbi:MAG TPA: hypothetical protein VGI43_07995 [Mucilaginibacter sp.]
MKKIYPNNTLLFFVTIFTALLISSCRKDHNNPVPVNPAPAPLATLGLYEVDSSIYKRVFIAITQVGTQKVNYFNVFDTGSAGMTIDATGILPASMITNSGIQVAGDSVVVNGITVTSQEAVMAFGNAQSQTQEYGNLAYATVKIGDQNGSITTSRIPMFLYYKVVDVTTGQKQPPHSNDIFGVGPGVSYANSLIGSPLSYFSPKNGGINGYKLALLSKSGFSLNGTYVSDLLTIGLVPDDIASSSGFIMHQLNYFSQGGYSPDIPSTITYGGQSFSATVLFDTGTPAISLLENSASPNNISTLPDNTPVTLTTNNGFTYQYTTSSTTNVTDVAKPSYTSDPRTIFSINFFTDNEFLMNYRDHQIGLKNN